MRPDYKNWVPLGMLMGFAAGAGALGAGALLLDACGKRKLAAVTAVGAAGCAAGSAWSLMARQAFDYGNENGMAKRIIEGTSSYITLPEGGVGLDVGCGSGALTIACAKKNPAARMIGVDRWGPEYASYSMALCRRNAEAEETGNVTFMQGDAVRLDFPDESFDAVTSNYVYHNVTGRDKQMLLRETLRVLKKGGVFAIHDIMSPSRYGDMQAFVRSLLDEGYEHAELIDTTGGLFMTKGEAARLFLAGSTLLVGKK